MTGFIYDVAKAVTVTAGAYSANDVAGGLVKFTLPMVHRFQTRMAKLNTIIIEDFDGVEANAKLYFYRTTPATIADNAAFALSDADMQKLFHIHTVTTTDFVAGTASNSIYIKSVDIPFQTVNGNALYMYHVVTGTPTYTSTTALRFRLIMETVN